MGLNKVIVMGRLTADVELRYTQTNKTVASFTVACDRGKDQPTDWIDCIAWEKTAEMVQKYFGKGRMIALEGRLQTRTWEDKQGSKHKATEVIVERVYFTGEKKADGGNQNYGNQGYNAPSYPAGVPVEFDMVEVDDDGDLPF